MIVLFGFALRYPRFRKNAPASMPGKSMEQAALSRRVELCISSYCAESTVA
jgi:hypothetical protein